jgi:hypothetical protein
MAGKGELLQNLREKGVDILFRENESGRIYGATVVDHSAQLIANGSRLGKEFSANAFQALLEQWAGERPARGGVKVSPAKEKNSASDSAKEAGKNILEESADAEAASPQGSPAAAAGEDSDMLNNIEEAGLAFAGLLAGLFDIPEVPRREERFIPDKKKKKKKKKNQRRL